MSYLKDFAEWLRVYTAEQWTAIFTAVIAFTGIGALWFASRQLKHGKEVARIQHLLDVMKQFEGSPLLNHRKRLASERLAGVPDPPELNEVLNFFELVGMLVRRGFLDADHVWENFGYWVFPLYIDSVMSIKEQQATDPNSYTNFEELYELLSMIEKRHLGNSYRPTQEEIAVFWKSERDAVAGLALRRPYKKRKAKI